RRADVDADAGERHMVLDPEWIFLERPVGLEIIMVVVCFGLVTMCELIPELVVDQAMNLRFGLVGPLGHRPPWDKPAPESASFEAKLHFEGPSARRDGANTLITGG